MVESKPEADSHMETMLALLRMMAGTTDDLASKDALALPITKQRSGSQNGLELDEKKEEQALEQLFSALRDINGSDKPHFADGFEPFPTKSKK